VADALIQIKRAGAGHVTGRHNSGLPKDLPFARW